MGIGHIIQEFLCPVTFRTPIKETREIRDECAASREAFSEQLTTRHLQQGVGVLQEPSGDGVPRLVIRHRLLLLRLQDLRLLLQTSKQERAPSDRLKL